MFGRYFGKFRRDRENNNNLGFLETREQFIPYRIDILLDRMLKSGRLQKSQRRDLSMFRQMLADRFHYEFHATLESLKNDFAPFDPDRETMAEPDYDEAALRRRRKRLYVRILELLKASNYSELTPQQLDECLKLQPMGGLSVHVDTDDFDEFHVFYRGIRQEEKIERFLFFWSFSRTVRLMKRVFVLARFREDRGGRVLLKMFKDVAVENLKIVAPKVKLGMPIFDRIKIGGSVLGSLVAPISKLIFALTLSWFYFLMILGGLVIAAVKGVLSFMNSRTKYMQVYSSSLYFCNLSNNKSAITALVDAAEDQEIKEILLAYYILYTSEQALTERQLDEATEHWIEEHFDGYRFDFEVDDALRKLREKEILIVDVAQSDQGAQHETYRVYDLPEALRRLDRSWDAVHSFEP